MATDDGTGATNDEITARLVLIENAINGYATPACTTSTTRIIERKYFLFYAFKCQIVYMEKHF